MIGLKPNSIGAMAKPTTSSTCSNGNPNCQSLTSRICLSPRFYLLAAPSTPPEARAEIIERAEAGESVPVAEVKRVVERHRQPAKRSNRPKVPDPPPPSDEVLQQRAATAERIRALRGIAKPAITEIPDRNDIGPDSASEAGRLRARNEELERENRRLMGENIALRSEIKELKATGGDMSIGEFQTAIKKWEDTVETQRGIIARLENENATLRAGVGPPPADDGIPEFLRRAP